MTYYQQLRANGASHEEAMRHVVINDALRIENFERYASEQSPPNESPTAEYADLAHGF